MYAALRFASLILLMQACVAEAVGVTYYVDSKSGDDAHNGTAATTACRSLERVNQETHQPGDRLLLCAGRKWEGALQPRSSGREGQPIVIDHYGEGAQPEIDGQGKVPAAFRLENQSPIEVANLTRTPIRGFEAASCKLVSADTLGSQDDGWVRWVTEGYLGSLQGRQIQLRFTI